MSSTRGYVEQRVIKRRAQEAKDHELRRKLTEHNILAGHGRSEVRVEEKRRARSEAAERRELFADYSYVRGEQDKARRTQIAQFEENLADELARRKALQLRQDIDKRRICDGSEELRALKERLHMAKVNKERAQQMVELSVKDERGRLQEQKIAEHMENERLEHVELEHKLSIEKAKQRERVKHINQQQITMKEAQRQESLAEYLKEKDQVQELVEKIAQEDAEEHAARMHKQKETKAVLNKFMVEQKAKQEAMEQAEIEENEQIEEYARNKREQERRLAEEREKAEMEKQKVLNAMIGKMEAKNKEAQELEQLRNDLHLEELEAESRRREEIQVRKRLEDREDMKNAYQVQMKMKEDKASNARAEEDSIRRQLMAKFAEDDRIEQLNEQKRRMKIEQHKREAQRLIDLRRQMYEQERQKEADAEAALRENDAQRQLIIEEERRRLLREHAAELKDFLPKHTLENHEDYQLLFG